MGEKVIIKMKTFMPLLAVWWDPRVQTTKHGLRLDKVFALKDPSLVDASWSFLGFPSYGLIANFPTVCHDY